METAEGYQPIYFTAEALTNTHRISSQRTTLLLPPPPTSPIWLPRYPRPSQPITAILVCFQTQSKSLTELLKSESGKNYLPHPPTPPILLQASHTLRSCHAASQCDPSPAFLRFTKQGHAEHTAAQLAIEPEGNLVTGPWRSAQILSLTMHLRMMIRSIKTERGENEKREN